MYLFYITILLFVAYTALILYYRQGWLEIKTPVFSPAAQAVTISVIIAARNEQENIRQCLDSIVNQTYPSGLYETIVVDDFSTDDTAAIITSFDKKKISLVPLRDYVQERGTNSFKKKAIETGILKATGELIVTTDADCIVPPGWLESIAGFYALHQPCFIAAPVAFYDEDNFLKIFQTLDFMTLQGITGASVYKKIHSMCNGANLAYPKKIFYEVNGFEGINNIASGDDMLLMHKIFTKYPQKVMFLRSPLAIVLTKPMNTLKAFFNQRIRWSSKADKYNDPKITGVLMFVYGFNLFVVVLAISSVFIHPNLYLFAGLLFGKTIVELFFLYPVAKFFGKISMLWWFPVAQPFHIFYIIIAGWLGKFGSYYWKERKVK